MNVHLAMPEDAPLPRTRSVSRHSSPGLVIYLWAVAVLLPMDWFGPTGMLLREFGAKPASLLLTLGGLYGLICGKRPRGPVMRLETMATLAAASLLVFGTTAFCLNSALSWSSWAYARSPLEQFVNQSSLLMTAVIAVIGNARLAWRSDLIALLQRILPWAAFIHLLIFTLQAASVINHFSPFLLLFRNDGGVIERPTGLMSEPSYYGVFAALYGGALLTLPGSTCRRLLQGALALCLYGTAMAINAKTMVMVAGAQVVLAMLFPGGARISKAKMLLLLLAVGAAGISFVVRFSALDVGENLSSAMRFGSTVLALNAGSDGYGLSGIGTGQFHFFYREIYAPDYLFLSEEGLNQMSREAANRASTFNLYARVGLELGVLGLLAFVSSMIVLLRTTLNPQTRYVAVLLTGSLGFLMTQDTYFYPPLVLACALMLSLRYRARQSLLAP